MKSGFEASVPTRKPKTQIGRVLTELTAQSAAPEPQTTEEDAVRELVQDTAELAVSVPASEVVPAPRQRGVAEPAARVRAPIVLHQDPATRVLGDWERLAALRQRLADAAEPQSPGSEPQHTAAAVRKVIDDLRARLAAALSDRSEFERTLETTRAALTRAETELEHERRIRTHIESQADEREKVAVQAVAEAEALAAERDLVIGELAERLRLENEQSSLLAEAEAALTRHRTANEAAAREVAALRDLRSAEVDDLETRLQAETAERSKLEIRCRELVSQVARLSETAEALDAIKEMVSPRR
ncbi:MAG: hypothetical protein ACRENP_08260 [Longimicrobiales bacterium]